MLRRTFTKLMIVVSVLLPSSLFAQSDNAQIAGYAKDASGAFVSSAAITAINEATGLRRSTLSNSEGYFAISHVPPGSYTLTAERAGFKRLREIDITVDSNLTTGVTIVLEVGTLSETIQVESPLSSVRSETATVGNLIDRHQIESTQLNGLNPLFLSIFSAGVITRDPFGSNQSFGLTSGPLYING